MSDAENFLTRWSRRKREVAEDEFAAEEAPAPTDAATQVEAAPPSEPPAFDPASLPPLDSITADTDLRAYFAPGVPGNLLHAALRRAWASDPRIRDFVGPSENAWDFNTGDIPGFGPLDATGEIGRAVAQSLDEAGQSLEAPDTPPAKAAEQPPASTRLSDPVSSAGKTNERMAGALGQDQAEPQVDKEDKEKVESGPTKLPEEYIAMQHESTEQQYTPLPARRAHGGALPD